MRELSNYFQHKGSKMDLKGFHIGIPNKKFTKSEVN